MKIVSGSTLFARFGARADEAIACAAFLGAMTVTVLVYRLGSSQGRVQLSVLLLSGIAANALAGAIIGMLSYVASDAQLRSLTFWSLGSLGSAQWRTLGAIAPFVAAGIALIAMNAQTLNLMQLGETEAHYLGVRVRRVKRAHVARGCAGRRALVSCTGQIGFIGLVAPHCVRLACGPDQRRVLRASALLGAILTVLADLAARTIAAPAELPLGILTAMIGAPFFLLLIVRQRRLLGD
ncbi:heme ABC transporter permease [Paraburkholderia steynii]|uniref:Heme ABC transporter permease n=1 Tax=Paraburkholderia steynii TaxID=1245441 RepID=A0A4R0XR37_9BURK|nr:heme ABC transporter permease [Paraburkholderia steynii]